MNRFILRLATLASPLLLGGCVAVWGSAYEVQSQTPDAMVVDYDTHFIDDSDIEKLAHDHCQKTGKTAVQQSHDVNMMNITTDRYVCQTPVTTQ